MVRDVPVEGSAGLVVLGWASGENGLNLRVRGQSEEVRLRCYCGRSHWIVREQFTDAGVRLLVSCHNCGVRSTYLMEGVGRPTA